MRFRSKKCPACGAVVPLQLIKQERIEKKLDKILDWLRDMNSNRQ